MIFPPVVRLRFKFDELHLLSATMPGDSCLPPVRSDAAIPVLQCMVVIATGLASRSCERDGQLCFGYRYYS